MKLLHIDIETAPNLAHVWGLWKNNVALNQLIVPGYVLSWAAKWDDSNVTLFARVRHSNGVVDPESRRAMLERVHALLEEADAVVTYNGANFDVPTLNAEFLQAGLKPPAPFDNIDLLAHVRKRFRFPSYKLEFVARALGVGSKKKTGGHELWVRCMNEDAAAWARMERYNRGDVLLQQRLYHKIRPWIQGHPNHALYTDETRPVCSNCGSVRLQRRGTARTRVQTYERYQCVSCGAWTRSHLKNSPAGKVQRLPIR